MRHTDWDELEAPVRLTIEARTGRVRAVRTVNARLNSQLAVVLDTDAGWVFVKGLRADHPGAVRQGREAMINPYVHAVAPRLRWHDQATGWDLLAFEYIDGARHADYSPGSPDLPRVISAMQDLAAVKCPDLPVKADAAMPHGNPVILELDPPESGRRRAGAWVGSAAGTAGSRYRRSGPWSRTSPVRASLSATALRLLRFADCEVIVYPGGSQP